MYNFFTRLIIPKYVLLCQKVHLLTKQKLMKGEKLMNKRVAIFGAGSLGTIMGAIASSKGAECILIDANKAHVDELNKNGATVTGFMDMKNVPVKAITPDQMSGIYDIVLVLTKQTSNMAALPNLVNYLNEDSVVCTLQNGIPEESVAAIIGKERTCGGAVGWGAGWLGPGISQLYTKPESMIIEIGNLDNVVNDKLRSVEAFLKVIGDVVINTNLIGFRWSKLLMNSAMSGMSAALGCTYADILDDDKAVACAAHVADELIKVSRKKGIKLEMIVPGRDFYDLEFDDKAGRDEAIAFLREMYVVHRPQKASMMQDMEKGIPCEIGYINGVVCEGGKSVQVDTVFNQAIVDIVTSFERKEIPFPTMSNLDRFTIPEL
jgi:2-dehydropantoate 2-reductase